MRGFYCIFSYFFAIFFMRTSYHRLLRCKFAEGHGKNCKNTDSDQPFLRSSLLRICSDTDVPADPNKYQRLSKHQTITFCSIV